MKKKSTKKYSRQEGFSMETKRAIARGQHNYCAGCEKKIVDIHHKVHNTATNRKLFPLFIQSVFNGVGLCRRCHQDSAEVFCISLDMAVEYEQELSLLKTEVDNGKTKERADSSRTETTMPQVW